METMIYVMVGQKVSWGLCPKCFVRETHIFRAYGIPISLVWDDSPKEHSRPKWLRLKNLPKVGDSYYDLSHFLSICHRKSPSRFFGIGGMVTGPHESPEISGVRERGLQILHKCLESILYRELIS